MTIYRQRDFPFKPSDAWKASAAARRLRVKSGNPHSGGEPELAGQQAESLGKAKAPPEPAIPGRFCHVLCAFACHLNAF